jgi:hypothetical protein
MPKVIALFFLRHGGRLPPRSFIPLFPSWCVRKFFVSGPTLCVARSTLALVQSFLMMPLLSHATPAQQVILLPDAASSFGGQKFSWPKIFLKKFLLRHAIPAQLVILLPPRVNLFLGS